MSDHPTLMKYKKAAPRSKAGKDYVEVEIGLSDKTAINLDILAAQGILGNTREEVILHVLRQALFEMVQGQNRNDKA